MPIDRNWRITCNRRPKLILSFGIPPLWPGCSQAIFTPSQLCLLTKLKTAAENWILDCGLFAMILNISEPWSQPPIEHMIFKLGFNSFKLTTFWKLAFIINNKKKKLKNKELAQLKGMFIYICQILMQTLHRNHWICWNSYNSNECRACLASHGQWKTHDVAYCFDTVSMNYSRKQFDSRWSVWK